MTTPTVTEQAERVTLVRSFELPLADAWDGRTLDVRVVPYDVATTVSDPPHFTPYQESFVRGAFEKQLTTPGRDRVWMNVEHEQGFRGTIGRSLKFTDRDDGLHGSFGVIENADGDKALELVRSGFLTGISLEFGSLASRRVNGVVQRVRAQLNQVSLCRFPAYPGAEVLAMREEANVLEVIEAAAEEEFAPPPALERSEVDELLSARGWEPLGETMSEDELRAAATSLARSRLTAERAAEARRLIRHYNRAGLEVPANLRRMAGAA